MEIIKRIDKWENSFFNIYNNYFDDNYYKKIKEWLKKLKYEKGKRDKNNYIDREQIWFNRTDDYFCKSWKKRYKRWESNEYDEFLDDIEKKIKEKEKIYINSCLINKYKTGDDIITAHKDSKISFGEYPNILIYSVGCERKMKINSDLDNSSFVINLKPNSLLIMSGASQKYYTHEIIKSDIKEERYSLTFREYKDN